MISIRDIEYSKDYPKELLLDKHINYLRKYATDHDGTEQITTEYLKMSGMYWCLNALYLMKSIDKNSKELHDTITFIKDSQSKEEGGFGAAPRHDPHILHTLSAIQILKMMGKCDQDNVDIDSCIKYLTSLFQEDGSFFGDKWGEVDTRLSFCGLASLKLLNKLDKIDCEKAAKYVMMCCNEIDGGFGSRPGSESHAAYVYCSLGSLSIISSLGGNYEDFINKRKLDEELREWLVERQLPSGGLNGRPEKLPDLCYSWWCLASLSMIKGIEDINQAALYKYILACQDPENGGFSDRPGNYADPYHTMFAIASLSLMCYNRSENESAEIAEWKNRLIDLLRPVDPILCLPVEIL